jgi:hypothetical protein
MYLELMLYWFIMFRHRGFIPSHNNVLDMHRAKRISSFVRCSAGSIFQGRVGIGFTGATSGDSIEIVFGSVLLYADSAGRFVYLAELGVVTITLIVIAVGVGSPREVFHNMVHAIMDSKLGCTKMFYINTAYEGDNNGRGGFVEAVLSWDKPAGFLLKMQCGVSAFNLESDLLWGSISGNVVDEEFCLVAMHVSNGRLEGFNFIEVH